MIKFKEYTPAVYYNDSRDFQLLGRLFDLVLNSTKTNIDLIYSLPFSPDSDDQLLSLMALTLGFKLKNNKYTSKQLRAICSVLPEAMRKKGSIESVILVCNAFLNAEGSGEIARTFFDTSTYTLLLYVPEAFTDINMLNDILSYILPAGISCQLIKEPSINKESTTYTTAENVTYSLGAWNDNAYTIIPKLGDSQELSTEAATTGTFVINKEPSESEVKIGFATTTSLYDPLHDSAKTEILNTTATAEE